MLEFWFRLRNEKCEASLYHDFFQPGLSDVERQRIQQKMEAEIVEQRDHHLTVLKKKSSIDQAC